MQNWKACNDCHGTGIGREFAKLDNGEFGWKPAPCKDCCEIGALPAPDFGQILSDIVAHQGKNKGQILRSFNGKRLDRWAKEWDVRTRAHRAYYVWRLYQFHAGIDVRMPCSAEWGYSDPYKGELDMFARMLVQRIRGHASAGVARWRGAMLGEDAPEGLPMSAYSCGPERMG